MLRAQGMYTTIQKDKMHRTPKKRVPCLLIICLKSRLLAWMLQPAAMLRVQSLAVVLGLLVLLPLLLAAALSYAAATVVLLPAGTVHTPVQTAPVQGACPSHQQIFQV